MYLKYIYMFSNKSPYNVNKLCVMKITDNIHGVAALRIYAMQNEWMNIYLRMIFIHKVAKKYKEIMIKGNI